MTFPFHRAFPVPSIFQSVPCISIHHQIDFRAVDIVSDYTTFNSHRLIITNTPATTCHTDQSVYSIAFTTHAHASSIGRTEARRQRLVAAAPPKHTTEKAVEYELHPEPEPVDENQP